MCNGIKGFVLGHKFEAIFDVEEEMHSPKELEAVNKKIIDNNFWALGNQSVVVNQVKHRTKIYRYSICVRCGQYRKDDSIKI